MHSNANFESIIPSLDSCVHFVDDVLHNWNSVQAMAGSLTHLRCTSLNFSSMNLLASLVDHQHSVTDYPLR